MANLIIILGLAVLLIFVLGILVGTGLTSRAQDVRARRQAAVQRRLNDQAEALRVLEHIQRLRDRT